MLAQVGAGGAPHNFEPRIELFVYKSAWHQGNNSHIFFLPRNVCAIIAISQSVFSALNNPF